MVAGGKQIGHLQQHQLSAGEKEVYLPGFAWRKAEGYRLRAFRYAGPANSSLRKQ
jgi:hypothetical protein